MLGCFVRTGISTGEMFDFFKENFNVDVNSMDLV